MKNSIRRTIVFSLFFFIISCASAPKYIYEEDAVVLRLKSADDLNLYDGKAHTLLLCVYQLKNPNTFKQLIDESDGISRLLECGRFDESVTGAKRLVMQPGEDTTKALDRAEGTKYLGIVAGYFQSKKENMFRLREVPLSFFTNNPKKMTMGLFLGPRELQEIGGK